MDTIDETDDGGANYGTADVGDSGSGSGPVPGSSAANAGRKRGFPDATPLVRRKRATIACQFCRLRKTKCDNIRPVCGFCRYHQARCIYTDLPPPEEGSGVEAGSSAIPSRPSPSEEAADVQHRELLSRLDSIDERLRALQETSSNVVGVERRELLPTRLLVGSPVPAPFNYPPPSTMLPDFSVSSGSRHEPSSGKTRIFFSPSTKCEAPLRWPIFKGYLSERHSRITSFLLEPPISDIRDTPRSGFVASIAPNTPGAYSSGTRDHHHVGIRDEALVPLCRKFLASVHTKNPILESNVLLASAMDCTENGLKWDAPSCLVLLACALACYTVPWTPPANHESTPNSIDMSLPNTDSEDGDAAAAYYLAAKKRIGLLGSSLLDVQCLFFASIYEKYTFNVLQSWFYLQQAATRLRVHHLRRGAAFSDTVNHLTVSERTARDENHLEERIFWAIFKAESDMLPELQLTPTDLQQFEYPDGFPYPPESLTSETQQQTRGPPAEGSLTRHSEERSWFFYLAELSVRRTINDVLPTFYGKDEEQWIADIDIICRQFDEFDKQMALWTSCLPSSIHFNDLQQPDNELVYYLQGRLEEWREWIHRPLLYYYLHCHHVHLPTSNTPTLAIPPIPPRVLALAREEVRICARLITRVASHGRHGGTWLLVRRSWRCAVVILGVVIRYNAGGGEIGDIEPPPNWRELVQMALATLARWSGKAGPGPGSGDIRSMGVVLEDLFGRVCERVG